MDRDGINYNMYFFNMTATTAQQEMISLTGNLNYKIKHTPSK